MTDTVVHSIQLEADNLNVLLLRGIRQLQGSIRDPLNLLFSDRERSFDIRQGRRDLAPIAATWDCTAPVIWLMPDSDCCDRP